VLADWIAFSARPLSWLIQWAIALRAAVGIASERERHTWDTLLTSPLEGRDIVWAKIGGALYAMRGLLTAAAVTWTLALACGHLDVAQYVNLVGGTFVVGTFMAAVGTWASLGASTVARAMTIALGAWLAAMFVIGGASGALTIVIVWVAAMVEFVALGMGWTTSAGAFITWLPLDAVWYTFNLGFYALAAIVIGWYLRRSFDRLAGRSWDARPPRDPWEAHDIHEAQTEAA
jgi:ABC-type transport system involved in multi-copper enzyme maturation permease subunit